MKHLITFLGLCLMALISFGQDNYDADLIPAELKNRANACIRNQENTVDMRAPDNVAIIIKQAITILNKNGDENARLRIYYDKSTTIKSIKGEVYNSAGKLINKFSQNDFNDESAADGFSLFTDSRVKHYLPAVNVYPYTIVYNYEIRNKQNLSIPDWTPKPANDISVEKSTYTFICKPSDQIRIKAQNFSGTPKELVDEKQKMLIWNVNNLPAVKTEAYSPDPDTYRTSIKIAPQDFYYYGHKGNYTNWQQLGKWVYDDLLKGRDVLSPVTVQTIRDLVKEEKSDQGKARKIYDYLQKKTRYISVQVGIGGLQPFPATEVDRLGYGDCKALVNYMQSLLKAVGIESYYCLVEAGSFKKSFDVDYASAVQGNHIVLCLPLKGDTTWLECTNQKIPFGFLSDFTDDRLVLACTAEGGKLLRTPKLTTQNNLQVRKGNLILEKDGNINGTINTIFSGAQYDNHEDFMGKPVIEQHKLLKEAYDIDNIDFDAVNYVQKKNIDPELVEDIKLSIRNYAPVNGEKMFLQLNAFNVKSTAPEVRNRTLPLYINRGFTDEDILVYTLPENINTALILPSNKNIKGIFGEYVAKTKVDGKKLTYYRKLIINDGTFPANEYAAFAKFLSDVNSADHLKLALSLKK
ncbi:DUF3857 domain-containing transglutaminase family protein [Pedobacter punctiformis]|uniref:DUF3857 domain-containing transglutaminase family protein n=1 Tax=Pedobacter punctiformis TaxID=3004097 RepID=A0ABT4L7N0_9SPHI|nr:DUF3857 domain-containing transglutaminase family protein [Pedobacter sp. HCMS5-2]MCZ4243910.1 DUF3857 domain-containing transglutaminase family protein [Pedobacter sp. HCMS5-2]